MRYFSFDASSERTVVIGCKPVRQRTCPELVEGYLPRGLYLWIQKAIKSPASKLNSVCSVLSVAEDLLIFSEISEISVKKLCPSVQSVALFTQNKPNFWSFFRPKNNLNPFNSKTVQKNLHFCRKPKTNPIQTQNKPNFYPP